jgi:hypothetical protein
MFKQITRLWKIANCAHPHYAQYYLYSTGAEMSFCISCGRLSQVLYHGQVSGEQITEPHHSRRFKTKTPQNVEDYNGERIPIDQSAD